MADEVKNGLSADKSRIASKWDRNTVADGSWLQKYTLNPLTARDYYLASAIDALCNSNGDSSSALSAAISSVSSIHDEYINYLSDTISGDISGYIEYISGSVDTLSGDFKTSVETLLNKIDEEHGRADAAETKINTRLNNMEAATDVIDVYGSWDDFTNNSSNLFTVSGITDNDIIKILNDKNSYPNEMFQSEQNVASGHQTYFRWINTAIPESAHIKPLDPTSGYWEFIGYVDPYYTTTEIDQYINELSATVKNNFLSANENAVSAGKNILIDYEQNKPKITIKTKEDVEFNNVSSKTVSSTNVTALTAQGNSAKFTHLSATNLNNVAISNLFGSAYSGAEASAWIYANSAILDIQPGYGLATGINEEEHKVIGINQAHCAYNKYGLALGTYCSAYSISIGNASFAFGESCYITGGQGTFAAGSNVNISGKFSCGLGDTSNINGNYSYSIGEHNNLTSDRQYAFGQGLSGNSFMIGRYNEVEPNAQFVIGGGTTGAHEVTSHKNLLVIKNDVISARDFSAGDVSLSSLTNMSAFGNGITDTATYNLSAVKLSAGQGIGFKNDTNGVLSITAEGTTYQAGNYISTSNKTIAVTGDLITSANAGSAASAWINSKNSTIAFTTNFKGSNNVITGYGTSSFSAGESNIYVRKDELECEIGTDNSATNHSFAQGSANRSNNVSLAQGLHNNASNTAQAFGDNLVIESAMAIGKFNKTSSDAVFVIGNGTADSARNDLMVVDNSAAITLINYNNYSNQVDKIIISTTGVSGMYDHTHGGIVSTGEYSSEWSNICNIENKYVPLSALKCDIGSNNSASNDELVFMQGMSNYAYGNSLTQGSNNSAINDSLAQGYRNLASSNSIAVGMNNSAYANSQSFGQEAYASAGGIAINPHYWGSTSPTKAINNSFAMGKECVATSDSLAFGQNNTASNFSIAFGSNNTASNFSVAFGLGISANDNQYIYGKYPSVGATTVFAIGNGSDDNNRRNYVSINQYGTLNLKNTVNNANKSVIINGHDRYIRSEENCRNIPFLLTSGYALTSAITESLLSTPKINTETLLLYGNDSDYLNMWVPTGTSGNKFKLMKVASSGTYKISVGIQAGYDMIFKNFSSGTTLASRKKIQTDNTKTSWPTPQQGTNISTSAKSFYFSAEANTTCVQFTEIPGHDDIDVIVDALGKHFIMIKNHSEVDI